MQGEIIDSGYYKNSRSLFADSDYENRTIQSSILKKPQIQNTFVISRFTHVNKISAT